MNVEPGDARGARADRFMITRGERFDKRGVGENGANRPRGAALATVERSGKGRTTARRSCIFQSFRVETISPKTTVVPKPRIVAELIIIRLSLTLRF